MPPRCDTRVASFYVLLPTLLCCVLSPVLTFVRIRPGTNLVVVAAIIVLLVWVHRILCQFYMLYRLNVAISTGQVVRMQTSHMSASERDMLFGEMAMLWRTNMQQQLLRARRISSAIDVTQLQIPFVIEKSSIQVTRTAPGEGEGPGDGEAPDDATVGVSFRYRSTERVALQLYWHVHVNALNSIISNCNHLHLGPSAGNVTTEGRKRKRLFGRGYISVNQATDANRNSFEMQVQEPRAAGEPLTMRSQSTPLFTDAQACARSPVQQLAAHADGWVQAVSTPQCRMPAATIERCACTRAASTAASVVAGGSAPALTVSHLNPKPYTLNSKLAVAASR